MMRQSTRARRRGLTLLELLIVVFIMAAIAGSAVMLTDNLDSQSRYDDTVARLNNIRYAIVGDSRPQPNGQRLLSGFVADMGRLPVSMDELASAVPASGIAARPFAPQLPYFDPTPNADGSSDASGDEVTFSTTTLLWKGFRGPYLRAGATTNVFRDGWGNRLTDAAADVLFHGWLWTTGADPVTGTATLSVQSVGSDGQVGATNDADAYAPDVPASPIPATVSGSDWTMPANMLNGTLTYTGSATATLGVNVLIYVDRTDVPVVLPSPLAWVRSESATMSLSNGATTTFTLGITGAQNIPAGRHLLVVWKYDDTTPPGEPLQVLPIDVIPQTIPPELALTVP